MPDSDTRRRTSPEPVSLNSRTGLRTAEMEGFLPPTNAPAYQEKIENRKPDAIRGIGKLSLEKGAFTMCREPVSDFGSDLRRGCRDRPQTRRLSLRHRPYTASLSAARDELFGDLFADQERMIYPPWLCHVRGFYLSIGRGARYPHVYISMP
jgi:hypothetical protein